MEADAWATKDSSDTRGGNSFEGGNNGEKGWWGGSEGRRQKMADKEGASFRYGKSFVFADFD